MRQLTTAITHMRLCLYVCAYMLICIYVCMHLSMYMDEPLRMPPLIMSFPAIAAKSTEAHKH